MRLVGALGGAVDERIYPGMGRGIDDNEVASVRGLLAAYGPLPWPVRARKRCQTTECFATIGGA